MLRKSTREEVTPAAVMDGLISGIQNSLQVVAATACAGIVIGVISLTGVGVVFSAFVIGLSQSSLILALILTALAGILLVPALVKLGVAVEAAHMFVLYFACLSAITPPVAITLYAANSLSGAGLWNGGIAAIKLGATGYIIPFMFVYGPSLLLIGEWDAIVTTSLTALLGVTLLAAGLHGYFIRASTWWERLLMVAAAFVLIKPGLLSDGIGLALLIFVIVSQKFLRAPEPQPAVAGQ